MFNWFRPRRNKRIFRFWNGSKMVGIDPIEAFRKLDAHSEFDFDSIGFRMEEGDLEAIRIVCDAAQQTFGVKPWGVDASGRESGLTIEEQIELVGQFCAYCAELKKNIALSPTQRPSTAPETSQTSSMSDFADSGSTSTDPKSASPGPSTPEPSPPMEPWVSTGSEH